MAAVDFDVHPVARQFADARVVAEDELLGLKVEQVGLLEQDGDGLFLQLPVGLVEVLDDFEVDGLVPGQHRLHLLQRLQRVDAEDLVEEVVVGVAEELQGLLVHLPQVGHVGEVVAQQPAQGLDLRPLVLEVGVEHLLQPLVVAEVLQVLVELLGEGVDLDALYDLQQEAVGQVGDRADQLAAQRRVVLQRELEEFDLRLHLLLSLEETAELRKVGLCWELSDEELLVLVEGDFEVFVDGVQQGNADALHLLLGPLLEVSSDELSVYHLNLLEGEQLASLLLLQVAQQGDDAGDCLRLVLLVLQQDLEGGQFEVGIEVKDANEQLPCCLLADLRKLLHLYLRVDDVDLGLLA